MRGPGAGHRTQARWPKEKYHAMTESAPQWSLAAELQKIADTDETTDALVALGLLSQPQAAYQLRSDAEWTRGGAETYLYRFQVVEEGGPTRDVVIKACVAYSPATPLESILDRWLVRRGLLQKNGVATPHLYAWGHGVILEEYLPHPLAEVLSAPQSTRETLLTGIAHYAAVLSKLGFAAVAPFADLRSRGEDVVAIDFGQDLGDPGVKDSPRPEMFGLLTSYLQGLGLSFDGAELDRLRAVFATFEGELLH